MKHTKILVAGMILFILSLSTHAQSVSENADANMVGNSYHLASVNQDWTTAAALTHPDSLKEFRKLMEAYVVNAPEVAREVFGIKSKQALALMADREIFGIYLPLSTNHHRKWSRHSRVCRVLSSDQ